MARDLSNLPTAGRRLDESRPPDPPRFTKQLIEAWHEKFSARPERPTVVEGQPIRPSDSGGCTRAYWYGANDYPKSNPIDAPGAWSMTNGQLFHDWIDEWFTICFEGVELEKPYTLTLPGTNEQIGGHLDAFWVSPTDTSYAFEVKSINGTGYRQSGRKGPRESAIMQGSIGAQAVDADVLVIIYLSLEVCSPAVAKKNGFEYDEQRFAGEWWLPPEEYGPIADDELGRMTAAVTSPVAPSRRPFGLPVTAEVVNPMKGAWREYGPDGAPVNAGNHWMCENYCRYRDLCASHIDNEPQAAAA